MRDDVMEDSSGSIELSDLYSDSRSPTQSTSSESSVSDSDHPVDSFQNVFKRFFESYSNILVRGLAITLVLVYSVYLAFAIRHSVSMATAFIVLTAFVVFCLLYAFIRDRYGEKIINTCLQPVVNIWERYFHVVKWFLYPALVIGLVLFLIFEVLQDSRQFQSLLGIAIFISWTYLSSRHPDKVRWRPVIWGFALQFVVGALLLRWPPGYDAIIWCADVIVKFFNYALDGAAYVFGDPFLMMHQFAFMGMPLVIYVGMLLSLLYYYGITQILVAKVCWCFLVTMGTTTVETLGVAASIFFNGIDNMLMLRAYLTRLTQSEFQCFLVGGHTIIAGYAFALFVFFGAPPHHLLAAALMSAPAVVGIAKLNYPETEVTQEHKMEVILWKKGEYHNFFEAMTCGAEMAGKAATVIMVNYITLVSLLTWLDGAIDYAAIRVGYEDIDFEFICSYIFWPLAWIMGVSYEHCRQVAGLLGLKIFASEILAFQKLGDLVKANALDARSECIATYAISGFSAIPTLCLALGVWNAVSPSKISQMTKHMTRAIINANVCCFLTASVVGLLFTPEMERAGPGPIQRLLMSFKEDMIGYEELIDIIRF